MQKIKNEELGRKTIEEFKSSKKNNVIVVLDNVRSLHNIGSIFRTADAFLVEAIYLCGITGCPPNKEMEKTALGATDSVSWKYFKNTSEAVDDLIKTGYEIYAIEQTVGSISLNDFKNANNKIALIFGNEIKGVSDEVLQLCNGSIEIPQFGTKHSFNVSVSVGIVLWELYK